MSRKLMNFCDLCKSTSDKEMWKIKIVKPGAKRPNQYDLCSKCASNLQTQLVSTSLKETSSILAGFNGIVTDTVSTRQKLANADLSEDELFLQKKEEEIKAIASEAIPAFQETPADLTKTVRGPQTISYEKENCPHYNKSGPKLGSINGEKGIYTKCKDCGKKIRFRSLQEREGFIKADTKGLDIKLKDNNSETRKGR